MKSTFSVAWEVLGVVVGLMVVLPCALLEWGFDALSGKGKGIRPRSLGW